MWRHTKRNNITVLAELVEFGRSVATVAVKDEESVFPFRTRRGIRLEYASNPLETKLVRSPTVVAYREHPVA